MPFKVTFSNSGGDLDSRVVSSEEEAHAAAVEMLADISLLCDGDSITVEELDE